MLMDMSDTERTEYEEEREVLRQTTPKLRYCVIAAKELKALSLL